MEETKNETMSLKGKALVCVLLLIATATVYHRALFNPFDSDSRYLTYHNTLVTGPDGPWKFWVTDFFAGGETDVSLPIQSGYYRPLVNTLFWVAYRIAGSWEPFYNGLQQATHWLTACMVFLFALNFLQNRRIALSAGFLFALHPANTFTATQPAAAGDTLSLFFYLLSAHLYLGLLKRGTKEGGRATLGVAVVFFLLSALSKESGATLPAMLTLLTLALRYRDGLPLRALRLTLPFWGTLALYFVWRFVLLGLEPVAMGYLNAYPAHVVYLNLFKHVSLYILRAVVPVGAEYPALLPTYVNRIDPTLSDPMIYLSVGLTVLLVAIGVGYRRRAPEFAFLIAFFFIGFSPLLAVDHLSGSLDMTMIVAPERYFYVPAVTVFICVGYLFDRLFRHLGSIPGRRAVTAVALGALVLLGRQSYVHAHFVNTNIALLNELYLLPERGLSRIQKAYKQTLYALLVALPLGKYDDAERKSREAIETAPDSPLAVFALSRALVKQKKWAEVCDLLAPWIYPPRDRVLAMYETNIRVLGELRYVEHQVPLLHAYALARTGRGKESLASLCVARLRGVDGATITRALKEVFALSGPAHCAGKEDADACIDRTSGDAFDAWRRSLPADCREWPAAFRENG